MNQKPFYIKGVVEGKNSVLFETCENTILYEKLANTIHSEENPELKILQKEVESVKYNPQFEAESLKRKKGEKLEGLVLNVTESCNFSCSYCIYSGRYKNERTETNSNMSFEVAKKGIDLFISQAKDPALISFYGGEPLNNMELIERIIEYTKRTYPNKGTLFSMTSNFYDADKYLSEIVESDLQIVVSLDGPKEVHNKYRIHKTGEPTWEKIMDNFRRLEEYSPDYIKSHIGQSITCADPNDILAIIDFFKSNEIFMPFRIGGVEKKGLEASKPSNPDLSFHLASEFLKYIIEDRQIPEIIRLLFDQKLRNLTLRDKEQLPNELMLYGSCYPSKRKLFIDTDGIFYMCEKFGKRLPIGNIGGGIDQSKIDDAIEKFLDIRNKLCKDCWAQRLCMPCIQTCKNPEGDISTEGLSQTCSQQKFETLISLGLYTFISREKNEFFKRYKQLNDGG